MLSLRYFFLQVAVFAIISFLAPSATITTVLAAPLSLSSLSSLPMAARELQYPSADETGLNAVASRTHSFSVPTTTSTSETEKRDINANDNGIGSVDTYYTQIMSYRNAIQQFSAGNDPAYGEELSGAEGFFSILSPFRDLLKQLSADKGLANYDKKDEIETLLKNVVNTLKNALSKIYEQLREVPLVGGFVYEIKCFFDIDLDATENLIDAILNAIERTLALGPTIEIASKILGGSSK